MYVIVIMFLEMIENKGTCVKGKKTYHIPFAHSHFPQGNSYIKLMKDDISLSWTKTHDYK